MAGRDGARPLLYIKLIVRLNVKDNIIRKAGAPPCTPVPRQDISRGWAPGRMGE